MSTEKPVFALARDDDDEPQPAAAKPTETPKETKPKATTAKNTAAPAVANHHLSITLAVAVLLVIGAVLWTVSPVLAIAVLGGIVALALLAGVAWKMTAPRRAAAAKARERQHAGGDRTNTRGGASSHADNGRGTGTRKDRGNPFTRKGRETRREAAREQANSHPDRQRRGSKDRATRPSRNDPARGAAKNTEQGGNKQRRSLKDRLTGAGGRQNPNGPKGVTPAGGTPGKGKPSTPRGAKDAGRWKERPNCHLHPPGGKGGPTPPKGKDHALIERAGEKLYNQTKDGKDGKGKDKPAKTREATAPGVAKDKPAQPEIRRGRPVPPKTTTAPLAGRIFRGTDKHELAKLAHLAAMRNKPPRKRSEDTASRRGIEQLDAKTWKIHNPKTSTSATHGGSDMITVQQALSRPVHAQACDNVARVAYTSAAKYEMQEREYLDQAQKLEGIEHMEKARQELIVAAAKARFDADERRRFASRVMDFGNRGIGEAS